MTYSLNSLYRVIGVSKQAVNQAKKRQDAFDKELIMLFNLADQIKEMHPGCGVEKMYYTINPKFIGRDKFCEIFLEYGYRVKKIKNYQRTTYSGETYYKNLIEGMAIRRPFQVIQTDITYFSLNESHYYLVFIIDVYTRQIVGFSVNDNLRLEGNIIALKMALKNMVYEPYEVIHHSDRGSQYISKRYTKLLKDKKIHISMGKVAYENPYAERINGIIKNEYLKRWQIADFNDLKKKVKKAVDHYNNKRLHRAFKMKYTPLDFYQKEVYLNTQERPTVIVYTEGRKNFNGISNPIEVYPREEPRVHDCPIEIMKC